MSSPTRRKRPPLPPGKPECFRTTVHGIAFAGRERLLNSLHAGDRLHLVADPPTDDDDESEVWVHVEEGSPLGHLPPEIGTWLGAWLNLGGVVEARALTVHGEDVPSWRRLVLEVSCSV